MNRARSIPCSASFRLTVKAAANENVEFSLLIGAFFGGDFNPSASVATFKATNDLESVSSLIVIIGFPSLSIVSCLRLVELSGLKITGALPSMPVRSSLR